MAGLAFVTATGVGVLAPEVAHADPAIDVSHTTVTRVLPNSSTTLTGIAAVTNTSPTFQVTIATTAGTISIPTNANLTLAYANAWSGDTSVTFTGVQADVDAALASAQLVTTSGDAGRTASVSVSATFPQPGYIYSAPNQHFYQYVADPGITWSAANTAAQGLTYLGQQGYLATMPNDAINDFVTNKIQGALNVWFGAESIDTPTSSPARTWQWSAGGPLAGQPISYCTNFLDTCDFSNNVGLYSHWAAGEPNNYGGTAGVAYSGEDKAVTNWEGGSLGDWNDLPASWSGASGYVVEYGNLPIGSTTFNGVYHSSSSVLIAGPPAAPTGLSAARGNHSAVVSFTPPATNGAPITGYTVTTSPGGATTACSASPCVVTGLTNGASYTFTVKATNTYGPGPASASSSAVVPAAPPTGLPSAPRSLRLHAGDRVLSLRFAPPAHDGGSPITAYQVSLDGGTHWRSLPNAGAGSTRTASVRGVLNGRTYRVQVRAANRNGAGPATSTVPTATPSWFHDPIGATSRHQEIAVPAHPARYHHAPHWTTARARAHDGAPAMPASSLHGRQLQKGQAASLGMTGLFAFDSARLSPSARAAVRSLARSLRYDKRVVCEGYADYGGRTAHERSLSLRRAQAVCAALKRYGAHVQFRTHGYGSSDPVIVGGSPSRRAANRRVVVLVTR